MAPKYRRNTAGTKQGSPTRNRLTSVPVDTSAAPPALPVLVDTKLETACAKGIELQLAGQLDLAADIYHAILEAAPDHAAAHYCLGMLCVQSKRPAEGLPHLKAALQAHIEVTDYWLGYLEALLLAGHTHVARNILALARRQRIEEAALEDFARRLEKHNIPPTNGGRIFIVLAPPYQHRSAGIRVLHTLCNELNLSGHTAHLILFRFSDNGTRVDFYTPLGDADYCSELHAIPKLPACNDVSTFRALIDDAYVIYPEVLQGNPLNARRVVRYVLNKPDSNGYPMLEGKNDFIVTFSRQFWKEPHWNAPMFIDDARFHDRETRPSVERTLDCTYFGKGVAYGECVKAPGSLFIDRNWPTDKEGLAALLRHTRYFFTWDVVTQTNIDALLCGAIPVVMRWAPFLPSIMKTEFGMLPHAEARLENGKALVTLDQARFDAARGPFIDAYRAAADGRRHTVAELATEIDRYFTQRESSALQSIAS